MRLFPIHIYIYIWSFHGGTLYRASGSVCCFSRPIRLYCSPFYVETLLRFSFVLQTISNAGSLNLRSPVPVAFWLFRSLMVKQYCHWLTKMFPIGEPARSCKVILVLTVVLIPADASSNPVVSRFDNLLKALDKAILYSIRNYKYMNFDGVFGLWIAEGTATSACWRLFFLLGYLKHILSAPNIWEENPVVEKLGKIKEDLSEKYSSLRKVLPDVVESLKQHDIGYFQRMGSLLEMDWSPHPATPLLDVGTLMNLPKNQTTFDEELSDRCISQLLVTNYTASRCRPSIDCLELITGSPSHGYELTHQILYIAVVMQVSSCCATNLSSHVYLFALSL